MNNPGCKMKEYLCCPEASCQVTICKRCYDCLDKNDTMYIENNGLINSDSSSNSSSSSSSSSSSDSSSSSSSSSSGNLRSDSVRSNDIDRMDSMDGMDSQCLSIDSNIHDELEQSDEEYDGCRKRILTLDDMSYDDLLGDISDSDGDESIDLNKATQVIPVEQFDDFLTSAQNVDVCLGEEGEDVVPETFPTTNVGEYAYEIEQHHESDKYATLVNARVIINQMGACLSRRKEHIRGWKIHQNFVEKLASVIPGQTIPAAYLEGMIFTSIFYKQVVQDGAIVGSLPTCLYVELSTNGFASINEHLQSRITLPHQPQVPVHTTQHLHMI